MISFFFQTFFSAMLAGLKNIFANLVGKNISFKNFSFHASSICLQSNRSVVPSCPIL